MCSVTCACIPLPLHLYFPSLFIPFYTLQALSKDWGDEPPPEAEEDFWERAQLNVSCNSHFKWIFAIYWIQNLVGVQLSCTVFRSLQLTVCMYPMHALRLWQGFKVSCVGGSG